MHQMVASILPKKTPLEKYREQKASIAAMLAAGEINAQVAQQLTDKLNSDLLNSNLI
jgi:hypothetical protein